MPLHARLPKVGFVSNRPRNQVINLKDLARKGVKGAVTPDALKEVGLIGSATRPVKILGVGEISEALQVSGVAVSKSAAAKITAAGGSVDKDVDTAIEAPTAEAPVAEPEGEQE